MGCGTAAERIFFSGFCWWSPGATACSLAQEYVFVASCSTSWWYSRILSHRDLRLDQQGIRRHEAHSVFFFGGMFVFVGILVAYVAGGSLDLNQLSQLDIFAATAIVGISGVVSRLCCVGRHLAAAHLGADWSCRCSDCGFDVARGIVVKTWLLCCSARRDESFSAGISNVEQMDRCARSHWNRVCRSSSSST